MKKCKNKLSDLKSNVLMPMCKQSKIDDKDEYDSLYIKDRIPSNILNKICEIDEILNWIIELIEFLSIPCEKVRILNPMGHDFNDPDTGKGYLKELNNAKKYTDDIYKYMKKIALEKYRLYKLTR
jgi:hypothetical protein